MAEAIDILERQVKDLERKNEELVKDNGKQRDEIRDLKTDLSTAQGKVSELDQKVPAEGSVILTKADAERWTFYTSLGKPDDLKAQLEAKSNAEGELKRMKRGETIRTAGYDPKVLGRLIGDAEIKVTGEGDERKVSLLQGEEESDLTAWAEAEGIVTLLNAARLEAEPKPNGVPAAGQAGRRDQTRLATPDEVAAEKRKKLRF